MCFSDGESIFLTQLKSKDDSDNQIYPLKINPVIENHDYQFYYEKI